MTPLFRKKPGNSAKNTSRRRYNLSPLAKVAFGGIVLLLLTNILLLALLIRVEGQRRDLRAVLTETRQSHLRLHEALTRMDLAQARQELVRIDGKLPAESPPVVVATPSTPPATAPSPGATTSVLVAKTDQPAVATPPDKPPPTSAATVPPVAPVPATPSTPAPAVKPPGTMPPATGAPAVPAPVPTAEEVPGALVWANEKEYLLLCEKETRQLHLYQFHPEGAVRIKSYPCIIGANHSDKRKAGDLATPVGAYFFLRYISGQSLPAKYGPGAFVLNYPSFLDRKEKKDGNGIWLHGHTPGKQLGDPELQNTKGCIVVDNTVLKELQGFLRSSGGPIAVVKRIRPVSQADQNAMGREIGQFMRNWALAWESGQTTKYLGFYAPDFMSGNGMNLASFRSHKEKVNKGKKFIRVRISDLAVLTDPQEDVSGGKTASVAVVRFAQTYRSSNFESDSKKIFYLKKGPSGWQIFGESFL